MVELKDIVSVTLEKVGIISVLWSYINEFNYQYSNNDHKHIPLAYQEGGVT